MTVIAQTVRDHLVEARASLMGARDARAQLPALLAQVGKSHRPVVIGHRKQPVAVLVSYEDYENMVAAMPDPLASLRADFARQVAAMQAPQAKAAVDVLFNSTPEELGAAAVRAAGKDRR